MHILENSRWRAAAIFQSKYLKNEQHYCETAVTCVVGH